MKVLALVALLGVATPAGAGPRALLDRALKNTNDASASFVQVRTDPLGSTTTPGTFEYRKPRRLRLEWKGKAAAIAYVRGDTVWFHQPGQGAVIRSRASAGGAPPALFLEESVATLERTYRVKEDGATGLVLEPKGASPWKRLALTLDPKSGWPKRLVLEGKAGESTRLDFGPFRRNAGIPASRFVPTFPKGTPVADL